MENTNKTHFVVNMDNDKTLGFRVDHTMKYADIHGCWWLGDDYDREGDQRSWRLNWNSFHLFFQNDACSHQSVGCRTMSLAYVTILPRKVLWHLSAWLNIIVSLVFLGQIPIVASRFNGLTMLLGTKFYHKPPQFCRESRQSCNISEKIWLIFHNRQICLSSTRSWIPGRHNGKRRSLNYCRPVSGKGWLGWDQQYVEEP